VTLDHYVGLVVVVELMPRHAELLSR
jgi:hypothetical protein